MAILTNGIFGPVSGRLGNLMFCVCVDGKNYIRELPGEQNGSQKKGCGERKCEFLKMKKKATGCGMFDAEV